MSAETIIYAIIAAILYAGSQYIKKSGAQNFDATKFTATIIVGAFIGFICYINGIEITELTVEQQLAAYAGLVAVIENLIKIGYRSIQRR